MKIHLYDNDPRLHSDPAYPSNMGSFGIVIHGMNAGLDQLGCYAHPDDADYVGTIEGVGINFKYKNKPSFIINVWDQINVIPNELLDIQKQSNQKIFGLSNQVTNLWRKFGVDAHTVMPGIDTEFYRQSVPKSEKFTFLFDSFANVRSGFDLALRGFHLAFNDIKDKVRLIVKNTTNSPHFIEVIKQYKNPGYDIEIINERISFNQMRDLYSSCHVSLNVMRHSSWGLNIQMAAACNCLPIVGDFCPSNEMDVGLRLKPCGEVFIENVIDDLVMGWGLHNAYGNFSYSEAPRFYDYDHNEYGRMMRGVYEYWKEKFGDKKDTYFNTRAPLLAEKWTWKTAARRLVEYLS